MTYLLRYGLGECEERAQCEVRIPIPSVMHRVNARCVTGKRNSRAESMVRFRDRGCTWAVSAIRVSVLFSSRWFADANLAVTGAPVGLNNVGAGSRVRHGFVFVVLEACPR